MNSQNFINFFKKTIETENSIVQSNSVIVTDSIKEKNRIDNTLIQTGLHEANKPLEELGQPLIDFPIRRIAGQNRKFNAAWYSKFPWLHYDIPSDSAFCGICRASKQLINNNNKSNFVDIGITDWQNAIYKFNQHRVEITFK